MYRIINTWTNWCLVGDWYQGHACMRSGAAVQALNGAGATHTACRAVLTSSLYRIVIDSLPTLFVDLLTWEWGFVQVFYLWPELLEPLMQNRYLTVQTSLLRLDVLLPMKETSAILYKYTCKNILQGITLLNVGFRCACRSIVDYQHGVPVPQLVLITIKRYLSIRLEPIRTGSSINRSKCQYLCIFPFKVSAHIIR